MKTILIILIALAIHGCGEDKMAAIGVETTRSLVSTNVTDDSLYFDTSSKTIAGHMSSCSFLIQDGELFATGENGTSQLGLGDTTDRDEFTSTGLTNVKSVFAGVYTTFALKNDGTLWVTGGQNGQNGLGQTKNVTIFTQLNIDNVKTMSLGEQHAMLIKNDGTLHATGSNSYGELGMSDNVQRNVFTNTGLTKVSAVSCGYSHTMVIQDGVVFGTGLNDNGQLGDNTTATKNTFTSTGLGADFIASGFKHSMLIENGNLFTTGDNIAGQLALNDKVDRDEFTDTGVTDVKYVSGGWVHSILMKEDGTVYGAGANNVGQIGLGATTEALIFTSIGITATGIEAGYNHSIAIVSGTAYTTGYNSAGQLALNDTSNRTTFTNTTESADGYIQENWLELFNDDIVRKENYRYLATLKYDEAPSRFVTITQIGVINELKPFDSQNITPAISESPMTYKIEGTEEFNSFTLAKVLATSVTYTFRLEDTTLIKTETIAIDCKRDENGTLALYPTTVIFYAGQQMPIGSTIEISLTHSDDIELGDFTLNNSINAGFTNLSFTHKIKDFNNYTPDAWGNIAESVKAIVTTFNITIDFELTNYDHMVSFVESISGKNVTIDGSDSNGAVADGKTIFGSLVRRVRVTSPSISSKVKDGELATMAVLSLSVQEIV